MSPEPDNLFPGELIHTQPQQGPPSRATDNDSINAKYMKGEVRIITEQARYPLPTVVDMVDDENGSYELNPDFQRRHRWDRAKQSGLIESFIMNVPIPP